MHLFYTPEINSALYTLNEEESKHCIKVLRLVKGDVIHLTDGRGGFFAANIVDDHAKRCTVEVFESQRGYGKKNYYLHIAIAPTKSMERFEWFLEKATELGIDEITPVICQRSERKDVKRERLNKIVEAAMKQSLKAYHPVLNEAVPFAKFITSDIKLPKFIAHCMDFSKQTIAKGDAVIMIGPEGDFSDEEIVAALKNSFIPITLGESRLRTETAALAACFEVNYINR